MNMTPKFEIVESSLGEDGRPLIKVVIVDDPRFLGYILTFSGVDFIPGDDGIGVSYELIIDIHKKYLPTTISDEQSNLVKETAHLIIEKLMNDFVEAYSNGKLDNPAAMV